MEPLKNPIEIPSQPSEVPSVEVPKSVETEKPVSQAQIQEEVKRNDDPLTAETAALKPDISEAIALPDIHPRLVNETSKAEDELLSTLNKSK
jgi:hypothetical protein